MDYQASPDTYHLLKRFSMPDGNGTRDAVAVSHSSGLILLSLYTLMIKAAITQFWAGIVLFGVGVFLRHHKADSDSYFTGITVGLWNVRQSPQHVLLFMGDRVVKIRKYRDFWYPLLWLVIAGIVVAASLAVPILKTQSLRIGSVAPVNGDSIFVPPISSLSPDSSYLAQANSLIVPAALRAAGASHTVPPNTVFVSQLIESDNVNGTTIRVSYSYGIDGSDFGLQRTPDLSLNVSGSCVTDYTWLAFSGYQVDDIYTDSYHLWNNESTVQNVSTTDGGPPFAFPASPEYPRGAGDYNYTYGMLISSLLRRSYNTGTDPWYLTFTEGGVIQVQPGRPALSCWEYAVWSYQGQTSNIFGLTNLTNSKLSQPLVQTFSEYLSTPVLYKIIAWLGRTALASTSTAVGISFNAGSSSILDDMSRLVNASYLMTRNVLADSTQISAFGRTGLANQVLSANLTVLPGADDFVVSSADIITLSIRVLIIVPAVFVGVLVLLLVLWWLPEPWRSTRELNAVKLHRLWQEQRKGKKKLKKQEQNKTKIENGDSVGETVEEDA